LCAVDECKHHLEAACPIMGAYYARETYNGSLAFSGQERDNHVCWKCPPRRFVVSRFNDPENHFNLEVQTNDPS